MNCLTEDGGEIKQRRLTSCKTVTYAVGYSFDAFVERLFRQTVEATARYRSRRGNDGYVEKEKKEERKKEREVGDNSKRECLPVSTAISSGTWGKRKERCQANTKPRDRLLSMGNHRLHAKNNKRLRLVYTPLRI